ncbi:hypothetical protein D1BOALGB6SA_5400 [Olavius sp. associated proteobacterium Delta 1]|nr:hypothetical protein D1BOALGB6SA_5400 [Olavius sp. associated proteobacterium Delta 1]
MTIGYFRLNIEQLRYSFDFKKDGTKLHQFKLEPLGGQWII